MAFRPTARLTGWDGKVERAAPRRVEEDAVAISAFWDPLLSVVPRGRHAPIRVRPPAQAGAKIAQGWPHSWTKLRSQDSNSESRSTKLGQVAQFGPTGQLKLPSDERCEATDTNLPEEGAGAQRRLVDRVHLARTIQ
jgi:hypothetical protein